MASGLSVGATRVCVRLWDTASHETTATLTSERPLNGVSVSPDGHRLATVSVDAPGPGSAEGTAGGAPGAGIWDLDAGRMTMPLSARQTPLAVAFTPDGRMLAIGDADGLVSLWDANGRRQNAALTGHSDAVSALAFSPDGRTLASAGTGGTVRLWNMASRQTEATLTGHTQAVLALAFSPDGRLLATAGEDRTTRLWDTRSHRSKTILSANADATPRTLAISPDGRTLATRSANGQVQLLDMNSHRAIAAFPGQPATTWAVAFSPDGRLLATAGSSGDIRLWDAATHRRTQTLTGHTGVIKTLAFSPDGHTLASGSADRTIRLWDTSSHRTTANLTGHDDTVIALAFPLDSRTLATASLDRTKPPVGARHRRRRRPHLHPQHHPGMARFPARPPTQGALPLTPGSRSAQAHADRLPIPAVRQPSGGIPAPGFMVFSAIGTWSSPLLS
ncbi:hypothetical protein GCM10010507_60620 [Streptomyces cinnamoneus]|uniref:Anaphase-promoting complex subunit 4 WD40 domain-containing protein n=1 Tax=Streptomyces cinnamoneus TaxID=53446 RepID=A0A918U0L4_STRCJ|nr:hypothetical protein GCM10010507_60620 [Streptomyces cinnamoneus]